MRREREIEREKTRTQKREKAIEYKICNGRIDLGFFLGLMYWERAQWVRRDHGPHLDVIWAGLIFGPGFD